MANRISIRSGAGTPTTSHLIDKELGFDTTGKALYINDNGTIRSLGGLPSGGTTGQGLRKKSNTDGDTEWADIDAATLDGIDSTAFFRKMPEVASNQDFNLLIAPGGYSIGTATNHVNGPGFSTGAIFITSAASYVRQEAWTSSGATRKIRFYNGSVWTSWSILMTGVDQIYPIGSIYLSVNSVNPETLFGGTWVAWGTGRVPVGIDSTQTEFNGIEETGGEKTHVILPAEMPIHTHLQNSHGHTFTGTSHNHTWSGSTNTTGKHTHTTPARLSSDAGGGPVADGWSNRATEVDIIGSSAGNHSHTVSGSNVAATQGGTVGNTTATNQNAGGDEAHNNLQPYITCYMWKRTA